MVNELNYQIHRKAQFQPFDFITLQVPKNNTVGYIASPQVDGSISLDIVLRKYPNLIYKLPPYEFACLSIQTLITDPYDAQSHNFLVKPILENNNIISIEIISKHSDLYFANPTNVINIFYFFPQMKESIDKKFCDQFLKKSPEELVLSLLKNIHNKNEDYKKLINQGLFSAEELSIFNLPYLIPNVALSIYETICSIQKEIMDKDITYEELFIKVKPEVYNHYHNQQENLIKSEMFKAYLESQEKKPKMHVIPLIPECILEIYKNKASEKDILNLETSLNDQQEIQTSIAYANFTKDRNDFTNNHPQDDYFIPTIKSIEIFISNLNFATIQPDTQKQILTSIDYLLPHFENIAFINCSTVDNNFIENLSRKITKLKSITLRGCHNLEADPIYALAFKETQPEIILGLDNPKLNRQHWLQLIEKFTHFSITNGNNKLTITDPLSLKKPKDILKQAIEEFPINESLILFILDQTQLNDITLENEFSFVVDDRLLTIFSKHTLLKSICIKNCPKITLKGINALLNNNPDLLLTLGYNNKVGEKEWLELVGKCKNFNLTFNNIDIAVTGPQAKQDPTDFLHYLIRNNPNQELISFAMLRGANLNKLNANGQNALHIAIYRGEEFLVKLFIENNVDLNIKTYEKNPKTPLQIAEYLYSTSQEVKYKKIIDLIKPQRSEWTRTYTNPNLARWNRLSPNSNRWLASSYDSASNTRKWLATSHDSSSNTRGSYESSLTRKWLATSHASLPNTNKWVKSHTPTHQRRNTQIP